MTHFPKQIHITRENEDQEGYWQVTEGDSAESALRSTAKTRVATYELKEVKEGRLEPVFSTIIG